MPYRVSKARTDKNQKEIVQALKRFGISVTSLANVGDGVPDLLVGYGGKNYLLEVKDGAKPKSATKLTAAQVKFHNEWRGKVVIVYSVQDALNAVLKH